MVLRGAFQRTKIDDAKLMKSWTLKERLAGGGEQSCPAVEAETMPTSPTLLISPGPTGGDGNESCNAEHACSRYRIEYKVGASILC
mmetsp:Transcript_6389/g.12725  ORF Transcript_6389/g.12725 Transcript_6389/m.12725 type:complete len:86 (-) Transcript_6389:79-336(-)